MCLINHNQIWSQQSTVSTCKSALFGTHDATTKDIDCHPMWFVVLSICLSLSLPLSPLFSLSLTLFLSLARSVSHSIILSGWGRWLEVFARERGWNKLESSTGFVVPWVRDLRLLQETPGSSLNLAKSDFSFTLHSGTMNLSGTPTDRPARIMTYCKLPRGNVGNWRGEENGEED